MENEKNEQVIFVKDLLFAALYQWRKVLICAVIFAVLLGGLSGALQWKNAANAPSQETIQAEVDAYQTQKSQMDQRLAQLKENLSNQETYNALSPMMQIDPYGVHQATVEVTVQTDYQILPGMTYQNPDFTGTILRSYEVCLKDNAFIESLAASLSLHSKYLTEMITISNGGTNTRSLTITIVYPTTEGARTILDAVIQYLEEVQPQISQEVFSHNIKIVKSGINERIDLSVLTKQEAAQNRLKELTNEYSSLEAETKALNEPNTNYGISKKKIAIFAILGAILGAGLVACCAWLNHICGGKIYSGRTLKNKTGIRILGAVPTTKQPCAVDRWLRKLEGRSCDESAAALTAANIRNYCSESTLLILDCDTANCQPVLDALTQTGIAVSVCESPLRSTDALEALPKHSTVILVEQCGVSGYADVEKITDLVADQNKTLAGCVLLDA